MKTQRKPRLCPCGTEPCRPGQGYGLRCHAKEQQNYRARQKDVVAKAKKILHDKRLQVMRDFHVEQH